MSPALITKQNDARCNERRANDWNLDLLTKDSYESQWKTQSAIIPALLSQILRHR